MSISHSLPLIFAIYLAGVLLVCTVSDIRHFIIPNAANVASLVGAIGFAAFSPQHSLGPQILGGIIGGGAFIAVAAVFYHARHYEGLGLGDAKFMVGAGTWVGWQGLAPLVLTASLSALLYVSIRKITDKRFDLQGRIPFGPFLSAATLIVWSLQEWGAALWMD